MQKSKFCPKATVLLQFQAGIEVDAVISDGTMYLPLVTLPSEKEVGEAVASGVKKEPTIKKVVPDTKIYTEEELIEMETDAVEKLLIKAGGDPDSEPGKNTHKKMRKMFLAIQSGKVKEVEEPEEKSEGELVEIGDLKVDDDVSVYWDNLEQWCNGTVILVKGGSVKVHYDDGDSEFLDPEVHTKIKLIPVA